MNTATTSTDIPTHSHTSAGDSVRMEVEPNSVLHTSPERLDEVEKMFISRYPMASAPTEIMAMAASPLIFVFCPVRRSSTALRMVMTMTRGILLVICSTAAIAIAPNATWDRPSPMKENRFSTSVTPSREEQSAISTPTMSA